MKIPAFLLSILFACNLLLEVASIEYNESPEGSYRIGSLFSIDSSHNETKTENKLRLRKGYVKKTLLLNGFGAKIPVAEFKASGVDELLPCKELNAGIQFNCKPIAAHVINNTVRLDSITSEFDQYVRRGSYRLKMKYFYRSFDLGLGEELLLYPLQEEFTLNEILSRGKECDIDDIEFFKNNLNFGHYFEYKISKTDKTTLLKCNGYSFLSVNKTQLYERNSHNDNYPEFADQIEYLLTQARNNGYLFSLRDVVCGTGQLSLFSLDIDFTIMQRKQFPYLTVKHYMETNPLSLLFNYNSSVIQKLNSQLGDPLYYTTEIEINSNSFVEWLDFKLHQNFIHNSTGTFEDMTFLSKASRGITVNSILNEQLFIKLVKYFEVEQGSPITKNHMISDHYSKDLLEISYKDEAGENANIFVKFDKKRLIHRLKEVFELPEIKEQNLAEGKQEFNGKDSNEIYSIFDEL